MDPSRLQFNIVYTSPMVNFWPAEVHFRPARKGFDDPAGALSDPPKLMKITAKGCYKGLLHRKTIRFYYFFPIFSIGTRSNSMYLSKGSGYQTRLGAICVTCLSSDVQGKTMEQLFWGNGVQLTWNLLQDDGGCIKWIWHLGESSNYWQFMKVIGHCKTSVKLPIRPKPKSHALGLQHGPMGQVFSAPEQYIALYTGEVWYSRASREQNSVCFWRFIFQQPQILISFFRSTKPISRVLLPCCGCFQQIL